MTYIVFDIGGTKMRVAASTDGATFCDPHIMSTPDSDFEAGIELLEKAVRDLSGSEPISAIAGGIAGTLNREKSALVRSPNIQGWIGKPLREELARRFSCTVLLENDTANVGLGEASVGAGRGADILAYVTVSTGVGGVRIVDGKIDRARFGFEIGHQIIDAGGSLCGNCGGSGDLEAYIGGRALSVRMGVPAVEIIDPAVWDAEAKHLATGLYNTILHWSPDVIVLGGSMLVGDPSISLDAIQKHLGSMPSIFPELPIIKKAELGDLGGLHGGLELIRQRGTSSSALTESAR